jgi:regulator of protease activity HflC (stomatin/prohibitin superfamily)
MTSLGMVGPGQMGVIEHFGAPDPAQGGRQVGPGLTLKWPWPFDIVYMYPTDLIQKINVGFVEDEAGAKDLLWGKEHYQEEFDLLVASAEVISKQQSDIRSLRSVLSVQMSLFFIASRMSRTIFTTIPIQPRCLRLSVIVN